MFAKGKQLAGQSSLYTIGEVLRSSLSFLLLSITLALLASLPALLWLTGFLTPAEKVRVRQVVDKLVHR